MPGFAQIFQKDHTDGNTNDAGNHNDATCQVNLIAFIFLFIISFGLGHFYETGKWRKR